MNQCKNCGSTCNSVYCPDCGTSTYVKRIDSHYIIHDFRKELLPLEKGFLFTTKELLIGPGKTIRKFLEGERIRYYKPISYVVICSVIYTVISHFFDYKIEIEKLEGNIYKVFQWINENYQYSNLIEILFIALSLSIIFRYREYNYFEHVILLCYLTGFGMLIGGLCIILSYYTGLKIFISIFPLLTILYTIWAIGQFYKEKDWWGYFKSLVAYLFGFGLFMIAAILFGLLLNLFVN